jgi:GNAT superfamily N-acetyltransferase
MQKRKANIEDIPVLIKLRKNQLTDEGLPQGVVVTDIDRQLTDYFLSALTDGSFVSWVMENDGDVIATSGVCFYTLPPSYGNLTGKVAYITNMYTKDEFRRMGIATELLSMVMDEARTRGCSVMRLHTSSFGRTIYEKAGFTDSDGYMSLRL